MIAYRKNIPSLRPLLGDCGHQTKSRQLIRADEGLASAGEHRSGKLADSTDLFISERENILPLFEVGLSTFEIAKLLNTNEARVYNFLAHRKGLTYRENFL